MIGFVIVTSMIFLTVFILAIIENGYCVPFQQWKKRRRNKRTGRDVEIIIGQARSRNYK